MKRWEKIVELLSIILFVILVAVVAYRMVDWYFTLPVVALVDDDIKYVIVYQKDGRSVRQPAEWLENYGGRCVEMQIAPDQTPADKTLLDEAIRRLRKIHPNLSDDELTDIVSGMVADEK